MGAALYRKINPFHFLLVFFYWGCWIMFYAVYVLKCQSGITLRIGPKVFNIT